MDYYEQLYANQLDSLEEMETHHLPRLNHEEMENLNRLITSKEIDSLSKNLQQRKALGQMAARENSTKHLKKNKHKFS